MTTPKANEMSIIIGLALLFSVVAYLSFSPLFLVSETSHSHPSVRRLQIEEGLEDVDARLIDGINVGDDEKQYLDWFVLFQNGRCGASLVAEKAVMTAAHCIDGRDSNGNNLCPRTVVVGPQRRPIPDSSGNFDDGGGTVATVAGCISHPEFGREPNRFDVAVIHLVDEVDHDVVTLNNNPLIPQPNDPLVSYGYGRFNNFDRDPSDILKKLDQQYDEDCPGIEASYLREFMLCAVNLTGTCPGDSGGPVVYYADNGAGVAVPAQVGIASFIADREQCKDGTDVYTRVSAFQEWVEQQIRDVVIETVPTGTEETGGGCAPIEAATQFMGQAYQTAQSWIGTGVSELGKVLQNFGT